MRDRDKRLIESIVRSARWVQEHTQAFPFLARLAQRLAVHDAKIGRLVVEDAGSERSQGERGREIQRLKDRVRLEHMIRLARAAKKLLKFAPGAERIGRAPGTRATATDVVKAARAMYKAAQPHRKFLIEVGFEPDFMDRFKKDTAELAAMAATWDAARKRRSLMLRSLDSEIREARAIIDVIDGMLLPHLRKPANRSYAFTWKMMRRVPRKLGRPRKKSATASSPPSAAPSSTA